MEQKLRYSQASTRSLFTGLFRSASCREVRYSDLQSVMVVEFYIIVSSGILKECVVIEAESIYFYVQGEVAYSAQCSMIGFWAVKGRRGTST